MAEEDARPAWGFKGMTEHAFRRIWRFGRIVGLEAKWKYTGSDTSEEWLEAKNYDGNVMIMPHGWQSAFKFVGHTSVPGLFGLTYEGERMRAQLENIDKWEAKNKRDRSEFARLKAKFGA